MSLIQPTTPSIPTRPLSQWPIGARLRFSPDADLGRPALRGTPVLVLSELKLIGSVGSRQKLSWRQQVLSFSGGCQVGWARPDQLTLPIDGTEPE